MAKKPPFAARIAAESAAQDALNAFRIKDASGEVSISNAMADARSQAAFSDELEVYHRQAAAMRFLVGHAADQVCYNGVPDQTRGVEMRLGQLLNVVPNAEVDPSYPDIAAQAKGLMDAMTAAAQTAYDKAERKSRGASGRNA